jgi:hypothetical protein
MTQGAADSDARGSTPAGAGHWTAAGDVKKRFH